MTVLNGIARAKLCNICNTRVIMLCIKDILITRAKYISLLFIVGACFITLLLSPDTVLSQEYTATVLNLPVPGTMLPLSKENIPLIIKGVTVHPEDPLLLDFIIDTGESGLSGPALEVEAEKLIKYFLASMTVPENELWVNLSPYESDRIIPHGFSLTEMGRDLLAQDYLLKQLTATLMYPEDELGSEFWDSVRERAFAEYGIEDIPLNTFSKVWIVPDEAVVYEYEGSAYVIYKHLKVLLEEDYLALKSNSNENKFSMGSLSESKQKDISKVTSEIIKEIIIPEIEREVNNGETFNVLRQVYNSMILAVWYKNNLKESLLGQVYADKNKTRGIDLDDKQINKKIYDQYVKAFEKGVYNYVKEEYDPYSQTIIPRKYFSGGEHFGDVGKVTRVVKGPPSNLSVNDRAMLTRAVNPSTDDAKNIKVSAQLLENPSDKAMLGWFFKAAGLAKKVFEEEYILAQDRPDLVIIEKIIEDEEGFEVFGGENNPAVYRALKELTGSGVLAYRKGVYLPSQDSHLSLDFARIAKKEAFYAVSKKQGEGKKRFRALVIGSGSGIDARTIFRTAKQGLMDVEIDAVDISPEAIKTTQFNFDIFHGKNIDQLPQNTRMQSFVKNANDEFRAFVVNEKLEAKELDGVEPYDIIVFNAPDAIPAEEISDTSGNIQMDYEQFVEVLNKIRDLYLANDGVAIIRNHSHVPMRMLFPQSIISLASGEIYAPGDMAMDQKTNVTFRIQNKQQDRTMLGDDKESLDKLVRLIVEDKNSDEAYDLIRGMNSPMRLQSFKNLAQSLLEKVVEENKQITAGEANPYGLIAGEVRLFFVNITISSVAGGLTQEIINYSRSMDDVLIEDIKSPAFEEETFANNDEDINNDGMREELTKQIAMHIWTATKKIIELSDTPDNAAKLIEATSMMLKSIIFVEANASLANEGIIFTERDLARSQTDAFKRLRNELSKDRDQYGKHIQIIIILGLLSIDEASDYWMDKPLGIYLMIENEAKSLGKSVDEIIKDLIGFANYLHYPLDLQIVNSKIQEAIQGYFDIFDRTLPEIGSSPEDKAVLGEEKTQPVGGIDLNPDLLNLQIKRDRSGVPLPVFQQPLYNIEIDGFMPVIINMVPLPNLPATLGLNEELTDNLELSYLYRK